MEEGEKRRKKRRIEKREKEEERQGKKWLNGTINICRCVLKAQQSVGGEAVNRRRNIPQFIGLSVAESGGREERRECIGSRRATRDASYINHGHDIWNSLLKLYRSDRGRKI